MKRIVNHLIQLQELTTAKAQQEATKPGSRLAQLDESIRTLLAQLPRDVREQFTRLQNKDILAIVPISISVCSGCGMTLPVSLTQAVKMAERLHPCPNCARLLYYPAASFRQHPVKKSRFDAPKVGIERFSAPGLMVPRLQSDTRDDAITELAHKLHEEGFVEDPERLAEEALRREAIVSTAVAHGLAFPHVRGVEGGGLTLALGVRKQGLHFGPGRTLTRIVFFVVIPTAASAFYLRLLSGLTQALREAEARDRLLQAETPQKLWKALIRVTRSALP